MIGSRLSSISSSESIFNQAKCEYEEALKASGHEAGLKYEPSDPQITGTRRKRQRNRKIIWFNPPFNLAVATDIGRKFFALLDRHFRPNHRLYKIINRNNVKLSYSCMPNVSKIIQSNNNRVLQQRQNVDSGLSPKTCNCRTAPCPLGGKCLTQSVIYEATLKTSSDVHTYIGLTEGPFKTRYNGHKQTFRHEKYRSGSEISKKVWELKDMNQNHCITWRVLQRAHAYKGGGSSCDLCATEKLHILKNPTSLNKRSELVSKCRHARKFLLSCVK